MVALTCPAPWQEQQLEGWAQLSPILSMYTQGLSMWSLQPAINLLTCQFSATKAKKEEPVILKVRLRTDTASFLPYSSGQKSESSPDSRGEETDPPLYGRHSTLSNHVGCLSVPHRYSPFRTWCVPMPGVLVSSWLFLVINFSA